MEVRQESNFRTRNTRWPPSTGTDSSTSVVSVGGPGALWGGTLGVDVTPLSLLPSAPTTVAERGFTRDAAEEGLVLLVDGAGSREAEETTSVSPRLIPSEEVGRVGTSYMGQSILISD